MKRFLSKIKKPFDRLGKILWLSTLSIFCLYVEPVLAAPATITTAPPTGSLGEVAEIVIQSFSGLAKLITAGAYIAGMGFAIGSIMKFKAHKDNPTQIPVGTPIALMFIAAALIFLPTMFAVTGDTLFGTDIKQVTGGIGGVTTFGIETQ